MGVPGLEAIKLSSPDPPRQTKPSQPSAAGIIFKLLRAVVSVHFQVHGPQVQVRVLFLYVVDGMAQTIHWPRAIMLDSRFRDVGQKGIAVDDNRCDWQARPYKAWEAFWPHCGVAREHEFLVVHRVDGDRDSPAVILAMFAPWISTVLPIAATILILLFKVEAVKLHLNAPRCHVASHLLQHKLMPDANAAFGMLCPWPYQHVPEWLFPNLSFSGFILHIGLIILGWKPRLPAKPQWILFFISHLYLKFIKRKLKKQSCHMCSWDWAMNFTEMFFDLAPPKAQETEETILCAYPGTRPNSFLPIFWSG